MVSENSVHTHIHIKTIYTHIPTCVCTHMLERFRRTCVVVDSLGFGAAKHEKCLLSLAGGQQLLWISVAVFFVGSFALESVKRD